MLQTVSHLTSAAKADAETGQYRSGEPLRYPK